MFIFIGFVGDIVVVDIFVVDIVVVVVDIFDLDIVGDIFVGDSFGWGIFVVVVEGIVYRDCKDWI